MKHDIKQKIIEELIHLQSRAILFTTIKKGMTANELSEKLKIPIGSVYKKLDDLQNLALIEVEKQIISDTGRKFKIYKSRISSAKISIQTTNPSLNLDPN